MTAPIAASLIARPGTASVTVTTGGVTSAGSTFTINPASTADCTNNGSGNAKLKGVYSFQFSQTDPTKGGELNLNLGAFTADGEGKITAGITDSNGPYFAAAEQGTFTGTYSIGSDDRGLLTLNATGGAPSHLCFALDSLTGGVAASGRLVSDDTNVKIDSGAFYAQGAGNTVATIKGSWAFGLQGVKIDPSANEPIRGVAAGYLTLDGAGKVTVGEEDISQDAYSSGKLVNDYTPELGFTGAYTLASTGRGTLTLDLAGGAVDDYVFYVAGPGQVLLLSANTGGKGGALVDAGKAYLRPSSTFSNATLTGTGVGVDQGLSDTNSASYSERLLQAGILTWTGAGSYRETYDQNDAGNVALSQTSSGTYAVDAKGRATLNGASPSTYAYLVGVNQGFAVRGNLGADFMYFEKQTVPTGGFTAASFDGGYSDGSLWYGFPAEKARSGEVAASGTGILTGTLDVDPLLGGTVDFDPSATADDESNMLTPMSTYQTIAETYTAAATGRFLVRKGSQSWQALYLVSPSKAYAIDISGNPWQPLDEFNRQ